MIHLAAITDAAEATRIIQHPAVADLVCDDHSTGYQVTDGDLGRWVGVYLDERLCGAFLLVPCNSITIEIHTCLLPELHGKPAIDAARQVLALIFNKFRKVVTHVPVNNRRAALFAARLGFRTEGMNRKSFLKHGELLDQQLMGLTHEEYLCQ